MSASSRRSLESRQAKFGQMLCFAPMRAVRSTIASAPTRTFASNALFFHDRSIRSADTNA